MSIGRTSKKSQQREKLVLAMLHHPTLEKAAEAAGISLTTAWRIKKTPEFKAEYLMARRESHSQSIARLQQGSTAAVSILLKIMVDPNTQTACRIRAASIVLDLTARGVEAEDLEARISQLEEAAEAAVLGRNRP